MSKCAGCYREVKMDYCLDCRKRLFNGKKLSSILPFLPPNNENLPVFQQHSKRLSISGAQLKYSLLLEGDNLKLAESGGQYILKPIPPSQQLSYIDQVPENEHLTMQIASRLCGIKTAENVLVYFSDGSPAYLTKRFDVKQDGSKYLQEDFAQLTSRSHGEGFKYEGSYEEIGQFIKLAIPASMIAMEKFFNQVVFNYVFSNGDAHLKNFSLYRNDQGEYQLTPAYDLLSSVIHSPLESDTALSLYEGDIDSAFYSKFGYYGRENFILLAERLSLVPARVERMLNHYGKINLQIEQMVKHSFLSEEVKAIYLKNVHDRLGRISS